MDRQEFLDSIRDLVEAVGMNNTDQQHDALNYVYTYWPDINNGSINRQSFADVRQYMILDCWIIYGGSLYVGGWNEPSNESNWNPGTFLFTSL